MKRFVKPRHERPRRSERGERVKSRENRPRAKQALREYEYSVVLKAWTPAWEPAE